MTALEPFDTGATIESARIADLVIHLLLHFEKKCDPKLHVWLGERYTLTLQNTAYVLEALQQLNLQGIIDPLVEHATEWLLEMPGRREFSAEESNALRPHPARIKTLALLGKVDADLLGDFAKLSDLLDPRDGWISAPPIDLHPVLVTLIWSETTLYLEKLGFVDAGLRLKQQKAFSAIASAFEVWVDKSLPLLRSGNLPVSEVGRNRPGEIVSFGDASYALYLLLRSGQLRIDSPQADAARQILSEFIRKRSSKRRYNFLHCSIHLQTYFWQNSETRDVLDGFVRELFENYRNNNYQDESIPFHALALRLFAMHEGELLHQTILSKLWQHNRETVEDHRHSQEQRLREDLIKVIRQSVEVDLTAFQKITGTRARGEVYRLKFNLMTKARDEMAVPVHSRELRLVVKKGSPQMLERSIERYHKLPDSLKSLFASHTGVQKHDDGIAYLLMHDLVAMHPLSEVIVDLDHQTHSDRLPRMETAAQTVASSLNALHRQSTVSSVVGQLYWTYLTPISDSIRQICHPLAFPEIKPWLDRPFKVNGHSYEKLDFYVKQLKRFEQRLQFSKAGYVHGDCHSRNIMLGDDLSSAVFVDIDTLSSSDDYMVDYGLLFEDVMIYQSLPRGDNVRQLDWNTIQTNAANTTAPESYITYPPFPYKSESAMLFQKYMLGHLEQYALSIKDRNWKSRLWLAIARGLFLLASRQLDSTAIEPQRRNSSRPEQEIKLIQVSCAEAVRLLHELIAHLDRQSNSPLPDLPFSNPDY